MRRIRAGYGTTKPTANFTSPWIQKAIRTIASAIDTTAPSAENEVAQPQIWGCHRDRQHHHHRPLAGELPKPDRISLAGADAEHHHIGARAHGGPISAAARSHRHRPPHSLHVDGI